MLMSDSKDRSSLNWQELVHLAELILTQECVKIAKSRRDHRSELIPISKLRRKVWYWSIRADCRMQRRVSRRVLSKLPGDISHGRCCYMRPILRCKDC